MNAWLKTLKRFTRDSSGIAYIEFIFAMPFLLALLMGAIEMTRYIIITQKVEKAAMSVSDIVAQGETISRTDLANIILAAEQVMQPYDFNNDGYVIISSVTQTGPYTINNPPIVNWQYSGGGTWAQASRIGSPGQIATLPGGLTLNDKDNVIVAEVFYNFQPIILTNGIIGNQVIYRTGLYKPRLGALSTLSFLLRDGLLPKGAVL